MGDVHPVRSRLRVLVAEKAMREQRSISMRQVATESGASIHVVNGLANNTLKRPPLDDVARLCAYLGCDVGDILSVKPDDEH
jgi:DNA-binding Xre family transcriptional regulator